MSRVDPKGTLFLIAINSIIGIDHILHAQLQLLLFL
jgi:hypothetical protein